MPLGKKGTEKRNFPRKALLCAAIKFFLILFLSRKRMPARRGLKEGGRKDGEGKNLLFHRTPA